jgi:CBS domain-containing protein
MKAHEIMLRHVITATPEMAIDDAVNLMISHRISGLPVVDATGRVVGMLSERDLLRRAELGTELKTPAWRAWLAGAGRAARDYVRTHARRVDEIMTAPAISITPDTGLSEVVAVMESRRIRRLPVLRDGKLVGIITRSDLVRALMQLLPKMDTQPVADAELRRRIMTSLGQQSWSPRISFDVKVENGVAELVGLVTDEAERRAASGEGPGGEHSWNPPRH